jgi:hypothetical protein
MDAADLKPQLRLPLYANLARNLEHECSALHELVSVLGDEAARLHKKVMTRKANNIALDRRNKRLAAALEYLTARHCQGEARRALDVQNAEVRHGAKDADLD